MSVRSNNAVLAVAMLGMMAGITIPTGKPCNGGGLSIRGAGLGKLGKGSKARARAIRARNK